MASNTPQENSKRNHNLPARAFAFACGTQATRIAWVAKGGVVSTLAVVPGSAPTPQDIAAYGAAAAAAAKAGKPAPSAPQGKPASFALVVSCASTGKALASMALQPAQAAAVYAAAPRKVALGDAMALGLPQPTPHDPKARVAGLKACAAIACPK